MSVIALIVVGSGRIPSGENVAHVPQLLFFKYKLFLSYVKGNVSLFTTLQQLAHPFIMVGNCLCDSIPFAKNYDTIMNILYSSQSFKLLLKLALKAKSSDAGAIPKGIRFQR